MKISKRDLLLFGEFYHALANNASSFRGRYAVLALLTLAEEIERVLKLPMKQVIECISKAYALAEEGDFLSAKKQIELALKIVHSVLEKE